ncbi:MAG: DNA repair protein RecN [Treponema sp.]|jgi:DNA repair protein RecN (Recombination protein N)|nr:DNA repair protein RecN [Treponema sp.]
MIEELSVRNFALIDSLTLPLEDGFTVLTGETGAGKSIIVGSLSFLLGGKADSDVIRSGSDEASVSAIVSVNGKSRDALEWLRQRDIETDDWRVVVRRSVKSSGRNSIYIQNVPVMRNDLAEFMGLLFDLHGQHSHESLLRKETHRVYLDGFSGLDDEALAFNRVFTALAEKRKSLEALNRSEEDRERRLELLAFAVEEITKAAPKNGEIKELEAETQRLGDFEKLSLHVNTAASALFDDETSLLSLTRRLRAALESAVSIDNSLSPVLKRLEDLYYEAEDLAAEFRDYRGRLSYDPARLEEAEERLSLLYKLKKKYKPGRPPESGDRPLSDEEGILAYKAEAATEIENLSGTAENREKLKAEISRLEKETAVRASKLSEKRKKGAGRLSAGITEILVKLGMPNAVFSTQVRQKSGTGLVCGPWGADDVEFLISANTGEPAKELARIASGGELSRVMLAIKTILCATDAGDGHGSAETLVFDEIDTGIGGEVALSVGEYLSRIGKGKQIFCVTHLATIAVRADNHLLVQKRVVAGGIGADGREVDRTVTSVSLLENRERRQEIARMLAGDSGSAALAHADELLKKYGVVQ